MKFSIITDEVTQDIQIAAAFAKKHALDAVELRSVNNLALDEMPSEGIRHIYDILSYDGLEVCCLASPLFKCSLEDEGAYLSHLEKLKRLMEYAHITRCPFIRGFSFNTESPFADAAERIAERFLPVTEILKGSSLTLLLEPDPSVHTTNCKKTAALLAMISNPLVAAIYDPGNDIYDPDGEVPFPDGYGALRPYTRHVHIKDAVIKGGRAASVKIGTGSVPFREIFRALLRDGYDGYYSLETHYRPHSEITGALLHMPRGDAFSEGGAVASEESMLALKEIAAEEMFFQAPGFNL